MRSATTTGTTTLLSSDDVLAVADWNLIVESLREAYASPASEAMVPPRTMARGEGAWLRSLTAASTSGDHIGAKLIMFSAESARASYPLLLLDRRTAELVALLDGHHITGLRTAATSALAADTLARPGALRVGVIGSGFEASNHVRALAAVRQLDSVAVYSPTPANRTAFAQAITDELGVQAMPTESPRQAVAEVDLVICAARSRDETPVIEGAWLEPGTTVVSIGSTLPEQREVDTVTLARADVIVADVVEEVVGESGDFLAAEAAGVPASAKVSALADVVGNRVSGRTSEDQIVLYKSVGSALQDIVVAELVYRLATARGLGRAVPLLVEPVKK
ncbi:ornithine cyclodeaminase family protein [Rhodococcus opacus]|uniref:ornithine cyclodeaminase family protein n=1 Tax=Rhodococcus opacus TaxID=37919 RepID=UPI000AC67922|nr:ornithine cyclodeaminase family protein [Rhodococcus opacus]